MVFPLVGGHDGVEERGFAAGGEEVFGGFPHPEGEPGQPGGAISGRFDHRGSMDGDAEKVGLELHHPGVAGSAPVHAQLAEHDTTVRLHGAGDFVGRMRHRLERGSGEVSGPRTASQPDDGSASGDFPVRRTQVGERGDEVNAVVGFE